MTFQNTTDTTSEPTGYDLTAATEFYNLKNKATGPRQYGYRVSIERYTDRDGNVAYLGTYQTLLNGERYQSSKSGAFVATQCEAVDLLDKTIAGALKRYARLALDPKNKIERRP